MSIIQGNAKQGSTRGFYPKVINGSLRFNDDDSAYLSWTPDSAGNRKTWTWSGWVKRGNVGGTQFIYSAGSSDGSMFRFRNDNTFRIYAYSGSYQLHLITTQVFRDASAWYHIVVSIDTTQATEANRAKLYVNGQQITAFGTAIYPTQNTDLAHFNNNNIHMLGRKTWANEHYLDGYLADVYFIDGQALTPDDFGSFKNGVWVSEDYAGTYGTNGFYLTFEDDTEVEAFNTVLYRGNGGTQSITGYGFEPDVVWIKERSSTSGHVIFDQVRGATKSLFPDNTGAESTTTTQLTSFDSDGFTTGSSGGTNESGQTYVAWGWKAGDSNVSNTDGSITSTVRANDTYGFSIVSYSGDSNASSDAGHGLSTAPSMVIVKNRSSASNWPVYHSSLSAGQGLHLNSTEAAFTISSGTGGGGLGTPTSDGITFISGTSNLNQVNTTGQNYIAYCWAEKTGYSKFGSYSGGTNPQTITTGFKPSMIIFKSTTSAENWRIVDNTRDSINPQSAYLWPNSSSAETNGAGFSDTVTFTDTGFTLTSGSGEMNQSGQTYIYAAFADTREAAFWLDQSGNDNDWQPVNLDHNDTVADSPTNNFCTLNPLDNYYLGATFSDGNLRVATNNYTFTTTTIGMTSGQYYAEVLFESNAAAQMLCGITRVPSTGTTDYLGNSNGHISYYNINGNKYVNGGSSTAYGDTYTVGDVIGIAVDMDAGEITFYKNGTSQGTITGGIDTSATYFFAGGDFSGANNNTMVWNFGQQPFKYDPPA